MSDFDLTLPMYALSVRVFVNPLTGKVAFYRARLTLSTFPASRKDGYEQAGEGYGTTIEKAIEAAYSSILSDPLRSDGT